MEKIIAFIKDNEDFLIATHINPEGDALGSAIALSMALESLGKKCFVYEKDPVPEFYKFLPGIERVKGSLPETKRLSLILVDCNSPERAAVENASFKNSAVIDHHETERPFGDVKWVEPYAAAAGLMVYKLLKGMGIGITREIAVNLYTAIAVDTGVFRFFNTDSSALRAAAELAEAGAEPGLISEEIYSTWSRERFKLLCMTMATVEVSEGVAVMTVTKEMFRQAGAKPEDTENFSNFPRMIKDIKVSALFRETTEGWKASLRSKKDINVARVAEKMGGGGHKNAAGFTLKTDLKTAKETFLSAVREVL